MYCVALNIEYRHMICVVYWVYVYAFMVLYIVYSCMSCDVYCVHIRVVLCCTPSASVCICVVLYTRCRCMCCMSDVDACIAWG